MYINSTSKFEGQGPRFYMKLNNVIYKKKELDTYQIIYKKKKIQLKHFNIFSQ
jgi:hypothetical protein